MTPWKTRDAHALTSELEPTAIGTAPQLGAMVSEAPPNPRPSLPALAAERRKVADDFRQKAAVTNDPAKQKIFEAMAKTYDRLAEDLDRIAEAVKRIDARTKVILDDNTISDNK